MRSNGTLVVPGMQFDRLTALCRIVERPEKYYYWLVLCQCGTVKRVQQGNLIAGTTRSCGCWHRDRMRSLTRTHGQSRSTAEFRAWSSLRNRCTNPRNRSYPSYGGRGITVCPEWASFERFYDDMGARPSPAHSIDRIDNNGPYAPWNCRWATVREQFENRRVSVNLTLDGRTMMMSEWAAALGIDRSAIKKRLDAGWSVRDALTKPSRQHRR